MPGKSSRVSARTSFSWPIVGAFGAALAALLTTACSDTCPSGTVKVGSACGVARDAAVNGGSGDMGATLSANEQNGGVSGSGRMFDGGLDTRGTASSGAGADAVGIGAGAGSPGTNGGRTASGGGPVAGGGGMSGVQAGAAGISASGGGAGAMGGIAGQGGQPSPVCMPESETCDSADNDCDARVDEQLMRPCTPSTSCAVGVQIQTCVNGQWKDGDVTDHCASNPCMNGGTCVNNASGYTCICNGFGGTNCETDPCSPNPCMNGGKCSRKSNGYSCACGDFGGENCEIDHCAPNPCKNGGSCSRTASGHVCSCGSFAGVNCEIDSCSPNPCKAGESCTRSGATFSCRCSTGTQSTWYPDCDGDGYAANAPGQDACSKPANVNGCGWTDRAPTASTTDCDDRNEVRHPGADFGLPISRTGQTLPPSNDAAYDLNCDGVATVGRADSLSTGVVKQGQLERIDLCPDTFGCVSGSGPVCVMPFPVAGGGAVCGQAYPADSGCAGPVNIYFMCR